MIRVVNEKGNVKKQRNWDRLLYLCLMALFLVFVIYYLVSKYVYIHANGHVIIESMHIRLTDDARIIRFHINEGDSIRRNDTLFSYALDLDNEGNAAGSGLTSMAWTGEGDNWLGKEVYALKKKIMLNRVAAAENNELINTYRSEVKRLTNEVILDVLPKTRLDYVQQEILKLSSENKRLDSENAQLEGLIKSLVVDPGKRTVSFRQAGKAGNSHADHDMEAMAFSDELLSEPKYFRSPISGVATRVFIHSYETALKSEDIMTIHQTHPAFIKAYFEQEDLRHFKVGDLFNIKFPDGTSSQGVLRRFYIATYTLPDEFQKKYEPVTRAIAGDIYPLDSSEIKKWVAFYKMSVDISKIKFD